MKEFFKVINLEKVLSYTELFLPVEKEYVPLAESLGRILAEDIISEIDLPDFMRSTMDGYAVRASSTFGASEANPAFLTVKGAIQMGESSEITIGPGEALQIPTGGMLPNGADSVVMIEHSEAMDDTTIEVYKSLTPLQYVIEIGEDFKKGESLLKKGQKIRAQETGLLAAMGKSTVPVFKKPVISIISTGDEIVSADTMPGAGQIRDINSHTIAALLQEAGAIPQIMGIVNDDFDSLFNMCRTALEQTDMVLVSGGSSVGARDFTIEVLESFADSEILAHGVSIRPGKPTILARVGKKAFWGLPGHVVSAMIVFRVLVRPFVEKIRGNKYFNFKDFKIPAKLSRNIPSVQGRTDFIRVKLFEKDGEMWAEPVLGKSGLISTMVKADALLEIGINTEGLNKGENVWLSLF